MLSQRHLIVRKRRKVFWHKADISNASSMVAAQGGDAGLAAALLQALRWRLDKAISATDRCQVLSGYIQRDILLLRSVLLTSVCLKLSFWVQLLCQTAVLLSRMLMCCCLCCRQCM